MFQLQKFWPLPCSVAIGLAVWAGCKTSSGDAPAVPPLSEVSLSTNSLQPTPDDPRVAFVAARLLENYHYLEHPLDKEISAKFYDGYIDSLDSRHENFLQSDLDEFAHYRTNLDTLTINKNLAADLTPAFLIYQRYQQRFEQHLTYIQELLDQDKFKFNADEKIQVDRRHAPFPKDLNEAEQLWRQRIRFDYLQDKLSREITETNGEFTVKLPPDANTNMIANLQKHYRWMQKQMTNQDSGNVLQAYLNALAHAYDPHSDYMSAPHAQDFSISMNLALFGIGAQLTEDDGYCTIHALVPGGPASKSKLLNEKDRIVAVAQGTKTPVDVVDMDLEKVVQQIRGPKGTEVRLTVTSAPDFSTRKVVSLVRDEIKLEDSEAKAKLIELPDDHGGTNRIGIIDLPSFYAPVDFTSGNGRATPKYTSADVAKLVKKLKQEHVSGIVLDLRYNPGGSLEEAIKFTGLFIKGGPVVQARNLDGQVMVDSDTDTDQLYNGPLMVMINRFSASAAEIAAAALQDYGRAVIVGDISTHGKGTVQSLYPLRPYLLNTTNDPGTIKITIRKFYRISGASTQLKGVTPDIILPDVFNYSKQIGESNLDNPLAWDTIQPATYEKFNLVQPYLPELEKRSDMRVATNQDFAYVQQDINQFEKQQADRTATLNEHDAIKERERDTLKNKARDKERNSRPLPPVKVYELTVKNSADPGLPDPLSFYSTNYTASQPAAGAKFPDVTEFFGTNKSAQTEAKSDVVFVYTNFFAGYSGDFTHFFRTNYPDMTNVQFVYTSSTATNVLAEHASPDPAKNQIFKPVVNRNFGTDPWLEESERILEDYISLLPKGANLTVNP
jgi:carboxyl-terminal processing protease